MGSLDAIFKQLSEALDKEKLQLAEDRASLEAEKKEWFSWANKLEKDQLGSRIKLDVGGIIFSTSVANMIRVKGTFFSAMFSGRWEVKQDEDGMIFIDRDPFVFRYILNFLRGDTIPIDLLTPMERFHLIEDAKYYQVNELLELLESEVQEIDILEHLCGNDKKPTALFPNTIGVSMSDSGGNRQLGDVLEKSNSHPLETCYDVGNNSSSQKWLMIHFKTLSFIPRKYLIKQDHDHYLRNWKLEGSEDGKAWKTLVNHTNDTTLSDLNKSGTWPIQCANSYSYFKILVNSSHNGSPNYDIMHVRFWGRL